jgi:hypothetical protein
MDVPGEFSRMVFEVTRHPGYVRFMAGGPYDFEDFKRFVAYIKATCDEHGTSRALIDLMPMEGDIPQFERYEIGLLVAQVWGSKLKGATLAPAERVNRFAENTAVNRQARLRVFFDEPSALEWLMEP